MKHALSHLFILLLAIGAAGQEHSSGIFSRTAISLWRRGPFTVEAPDKSAAMVAKSNCDDEGYTCIVIRAHGRTYSTRIGSWVNAEILWAPDSRAFFVTYSDGGNIGTYHVKVFYVQPRGLRVIEPVPNGRRLFPPTCFDPERSNVGAIQWGKDSSRLVIAVEVPPHSSCASMGTFRAFEISLPEAQVLKRYGQLQAKRLFATSIGEELRNADDDCVRRPDTCIPNGMKVQHRNSPQQ